MEPVLLVIHLIIALGIIVLVLIQPAESGGFLGSGGSMSNMMAPRRKGDVLTRTTGILATAFFVTSLLLAIVASHGGAKPASILDAADTGTVEQAVDGDAAATPAVEGATDAPVADEAAPAEDVIPKAPISQ